ncbi:hypothetical protein PR003_g17433 [Phytophthora rubi]|uniref:Uncharacterized protein n=1 Tax=Phytophthora rubi TaxID=129364 RepID=A0A6A4EMY4_9STRA|nr:hypothetical protein PR003_g17433 [Phytophthora rubi]
MIRTDTGGTSKATKRMLPPTRVDAGTSVTTPRSTTSAATTHTNTSASATTTSVGTPALQAPSQLSVMDHVLQPWN